MQPSDWTPRVLPIIAEHLALDFANTVDDPLGPERYDHAGTYPELVQWAERVGLLDSRSSSALIDQAETHPVRAAHALTLAHELRDALNDLFGALADGGGMLPRHWLALRPFVARAWADAELNPAVLQDSPWQWAPSEPGAFLHPIAVSAADLLADHRLAQLRRCARCPWLFLDNSRNHTRRWCDMDDCGRAAKIEKILAKRAAARKGQPRVTPR